MRFSFSLLYNLCDPAKLKFELTYLTCIFKFIFHPTELLKPYEQHKQQASCVRQGAVDSPSGTVVLKNSSFPILYPNILVSEKPNESVHCSSLPRLFIILLPPAFTVYYSLREKWLTLVGAEDIEVFSLNMIKEHISYIPFYEQCSGVVTQW